MLNSSNNIDYHFKSATSFSHLIGCITGLLVQYILYPFPDNYFKTIRSTTEIEYNERAKVLRNILKKPRPMLIIDPKFDPSDDTSFMPNSEFDWEIPNESDNSSAWNTMDIGDPFMMDEDKKFFMYNKVARYKITFNLIFIFDSAIQEMQIQEHMRQNIRHKSTIVLPRYVEENIPDNFMSAVALMLGMDINSDEFMNKINTISNIPITHRVRPGSGNKEFFMLCPTTLQVLFTSLPSSNGAERKGKLVTSASFTENVEIEFPANSTYFLRTNVNVGDKIDMSDAVILAQSTSKIVTSLNNIEHNLDINANVPLFLDYNNNQRKFVEINIQFNTASSESIDLTQYINGEVKRMVEYYISQGLPNDFLSCSVSEGYTILGSDRYSFDFSKLTLTVTNTNEYKVYTAAMYADFLHINTLKKTLDTYDEAN